MYPSVLRARVLGDRAPRAPGRAGPAHEARAEEVHREAIRLAPRPERRFDLGLLCQRRAHRAEGAELLRTARRREAALKELGFS